MKTENAGPPAVNATEAGTGTQKINAHADGKSPSGINSVASWALRSRARLSQEKSHHGLGAVPEIFKIWRYV